MKHKQQITLLDLRDPKIKKGYKVRIIDGSGLTVHERTQAFSINPVSPHQAYIIDCYPHLTGLVQDLKDITGTVVESKVTNKASITSLNDRAYIQDIVVQLGTGLFRTCSQFVRKV